MIRGSALLVACTIAGSVWSRRAEACSFDMPVPIVQFPGDGAADVPTNPRLWFAELEAREADALIVRSIDGREIPLATTFVGHEISMFVVGTPIEELLPRTSYEVASCLGETCGPAFRTFTTGDEADLDPPSPPEEIAREPGTDRGLGPCGGRFDWVDVDLAFEGLLVVDADVPEFDDRTLSGRVDWLATDPEESVRFGELGIGLRPTIHARIGTLDEAGNFSGWVELDPIEVPGCGCSSAPRSNAITSCMSLLVLLVARRRRPARTS